MLNMRDLGYQEDPFSLVPPSAPTSRWIGRPEHKARLDAIAAVWEITPSSSIHLMWAELGAGKTHALRYLQMKVVNSATPGTAVYASMPNAADGFKSVHRRIVEQIPESLMVDAVENLRAAHRSAWLLAPELDGDRDTARVLWHLRQTSNQEAGELGRRWLRGERLYAAETRHLGGVQWHRTDEDAVRSLATIVRLLNISGHRFVVLLDEFQRIGESNRSNANRVNVGLHSLYNACPNGLGMVLSYSIGDASAMDHLISPELRSRVSDTLNLPSMTVEEATEFAHDLLKSCPTRDGRLLFEPDAVSAAICSVTKKGNRELIPREIIRAFQRPFHRALVAGNGNQVPIDSVTFDQLSE